MSRLVRVYQTALPPSLVDRMLPEINILSDYEASLPSLKDSKRRTRWFEFTKKKPSILLEEVVRRLSILAKPSHKIIGGEWWIQRVGQTEPIGFHIDKDESIASLQQRMVVPEWSSVFYVTDVGGGTLITDQGSPQGNGYYPIIPEHGALSMPKKNKYLLFNGTLLHGVIKGERVPNVHSPRFTFLVNYWPTKPEAPNCDELNYDDIPSLTRFRTESEYDAFKTELDNEMSQLFSMTGSLSSTTSDNNDNNNKPRYGIKDKLTFIDLSNADQQVDDEDEEKEGDNNNNNKNITESYLFSMDLPGKRRQSVYVPKKVEIGKTYHILWKKSPENERKAQEKKKAQQAKKKKRKIIEEEEEDEEEEENEEEEDETPKKKSKKSSSSKKKQSKGKEKGGKGKKSRKVIVEEEEEDDDDEEGSGGSIYDRYTPTKTVDKKSKKKSSKKNQKIDDDGDDNEEEESEEEEEEEESSDDDDEEEIERRRKQSLRNKKKAKAKKQQRQKATKKNTAKKGKKIRDEL